MSDSSTDSYSGEIEALFDQLAVDLRPLCSGADFAPEVEALNRCFRTAHSLKGICGLGERPHLSQLAHALEEILNGLRLGRLRLGAPVQSGLLEGVDLLGRSLTGSAGDDDEAAIAAFIERVQALLAANEGGQDRSSLEQILPESLLAQLSEYEEQRLCRAVEQAHSVVLVQGRFPVPNLDQDLNALVERLTRVAEVVGTLPWDEGGGDGNLGLQLLVVTPNAPESLTSHLLPTEGPPFHCRTLLEAGRPPGIEAAPSRDTDDSDIRSYSPSIRIDIGHLDQLVHSVGELYLIKSDLDRWMEGLTLQGEGRQQQDALRLSRRLDKRLDALRRTALEMRTVPMRQLLDRLWRVVQHTGDALGKKVRVKLDGEDTRVDKLLLEELANPLMHLVRNAVDHGIELPEERCRAGKDPVGEVAISVRRVGQQLSVEVADDGRGADIGRLAEIAEKRGLVASGAGLTPEEILDLVYLPGMSSRTEVGEFSGRGVGLDVVRDQISRMAGRVQATNRPGRGMQVGISLPATLSLSTVLVVGAADRTYALPASAVRETVRLDRPSGHGAGEETLQVRDETLPRVTLSRFFGTAPGPGDPAAGYAVVVALGDRLLALQVDTVVGQQEAMVRPMGPLLEEIPGLAGVAVLGNDRLALLVDVGSLVSGVGSERVE